MRGRGSVRPEGQNALQMSVSWSKGGTCADAVVGSRRVLLDPALPIEVRELPDDLAALDEVLSDAGLLGRSSSASGGPSRRAAGRC
jgi:hypothetical protein